MANTQFTWANQTLTVAVGSPATLGRTNYTLPYPLTVTAVPGAGGTLLVEYQIAADGVWQAWPGGTVSTTTTYLLTGPVRALKFTATTQAGVVEVAQ